MFAFKFLGNLYVSPPCPPSGKLISSLAGCSYSLAALVKTLLPRVDGGAAPSCCGLLLGLCLEGGLVT
jgi:hypothetical protein